MVSLWSALTLTIAAGVVVLRWWLKRYDALGRSRPFPTIAVPLLLALAAACLTPWILRVRLENRLAEAASHVTGAPVSVHCQSLGEAFVDVGSELGYVKFGADGTPEKATFIKRNQCRDLAAYLRSDKVAPSTKEVVALHTLTHEAIHMSGIMNEAKTECLAVQHDAEMARLLGASPEAAAELAGRYWRAIYPRMPADYRSDQCGPDLALDAGRPDSPWALSGEVVGTSP